MKRFLLLVYLCLSANVYADNLVDSTIPIKSIVVDESIPEESAKFLESRIEQILTRNGCASSSSTSRFYLAAKSSIISKGIVQTTPVKISLRMEVHFYLGDVISNKLYESASVTVAGVGISETKAYSSAFQKISSQNVQVQEMLTKAKNEIISYYNNQYETILSKAEYLSSLNKYDEAIAALMEVPEVCRNPYEKCLSKASEIYQLKIDYDAEMLILKALNIWASEQNSNGATEVMKLLNLIDPKTKHFKKVTELRNEISSKLDEQTRQEWEMEIRKYEDSQLFKRSIVEACKEIGVAWGNHQPQNVTKNIKTWW